MFIRRWAAALPLALIVSTALPSAASHREWAADRAPSASSYSQLRVRVYSANVANVVAGEVLPLQALAWTRAGERDNVTQDVRWEVSPPSAGWVDELDRFVGSRPGRATVTARLGSLRSQPLELQVLGHGTPAWEVVGIERVRGGRRGGAMWCASVRNKGTGAASRVSYEWRVDGRTVQTGVLPKLERFRQTEALISLPDDGRRRRLEFRVKGGRTAGGSSLAVRTG